MLRYGNTCKNKNVGADSISARHPKFVTPQASSEAILLRFVTPQVVGADSISARCLHFITPPFLPLITRTKDFTYPRHLVSTSVCEQ